MQTIPQLVESFKDNQHLAFNYTITYAQLYCLVLNKACHLQNNGVVQSDIVGLVADNGPDWCISHLAIGYLGAIVLPLDTNLPPENHQAMLQKVQAKLVLISGNFDYLKNDFITLLVSDYPANKQHLTPIKVKASDTASLLFTSGTTASPKIVQLTHGNIVETGVNAKIFIEVGQEDVMLALLPLYHVYALIANMYAPLATGCQIVFCPSLKGSDILETLKNNRITIVAGIPQLWELFFDGILQKVKNSSKLKYTLFRTTLKYSPTLKKLGLGFICNIIFQPVHKAFGGQINFLLSGGAALKTEYYRYYTNMGFKFIEGYGLTETTGPITLNKKNTAAPGSAGQPLSGNFVQIRNLNEDNLGQIWVKGTSVMKGYLLYDSANQEIFDAEGWMNTGDLGYIDTIGNLHITGREKNIIVLDSGKNVYPDELEEYYSKSQKIAEIAVFAYQIERAEVAFAVIVPKPAHTFNDIKQELQKLNKNLPTYKTIQHFALSQEPLPRTSTKKYIVRQLIANLQNSKYQKEDSGVVKQIVTTQEEAQIINFLKKTLNKKQLSPQQTLEDLGIDSMSKIYLIGCLENHFKFAIDGDDFFKLLTIKDVVNYLQKRPYQEPSDNIISSQIKTKVSNVSNPVVDFLLFLFLNIAKKFWKLEINNIHHLIIDNSIVIANHQSNLDIALVLACLPRKFRKDICIIGKKQIIFLKYLFPGMNIICVDRQGNILPALQAGADILRQGKSLLIFPEGTRSTDGTLRKFKSGAAYLAKNLDKNIVPLTLNGSGNGVGSVLPKGAFFPKLFPKNKLSLTVNKLIISKDYASVEELSAKCFQVINSSLFA